MIDPWIAVLSVACTVVLAYLAGYARGQCDGYAAGKERKP